ncbi:MAG: phage portal protein [Hahellaceae bacterium]|nr:phage portal protein [Hahellaceae bacterium]
MASILEKMIAYLSPESAYRREQARLRAHAVMAARAKYDAAQSGRRNRSWLVTTTSANSEVGAALPVLRARSRDLVRNNPYASKAIEVIVSNTVGSGIVPSAKSKSKRRQDLANQLMAEWMQDCDIHGRLDLYGIQSLMMRAESESGEALLIRKLGGKGRIPMKLELREGDYLDHTKTTDGTLGAHICYGVQFDAQKHISGYWLHHSHPGDMTTVATIPSLIPADQVIHMFEMRRPEQCRGIPRGVAGFQKMKNLDDFQDARLEQQKIAACMVGIITDLNGDGNTGDTLPEKLEPGMFPQLASGKDVKFNNPPSVSGHAEFTTLEQKSIAAAYGITYEALTGDLSNTNFSSARMGWIEFSRNVDRWRWNMLVPAMKKLEAWFLEAAQLAGHDLGDVTFEWTPPRREMIDPTKEIGAQIKAIRGGLKSWQETARENGYDPAMLLDEIAEDNKRFDDLNLVLDSDARKATSSGRLQVETQTQPSTEE